MITFGSVCSGIEAASVAWAPLGWRAAWFAEIAPFPRAVLAHHYPDTPNLGDMSALSDKIRSGQITAPDVLCGGTPCQAFSVAGKRGSLADARGNLSLTFCDIADAIDDARSILGLPPSIVFWENVPGVLSTHDNAFGCFLAQLCGGDVPLDASDGWTDAGCVSGPRRTVAWRILDAQYFGLAQRRRRVFVVASARDGFDPAAVLFEFEGVRRDTAPACEQGATASLGGKNEGAFPGTWWDGGQLSQTLDAVLYKRQAMPEKARFPAVLVPAWRPCECCDEYMCDIHGEHVHDCDCPGIDEWAEHDVWPYGPAVLRYITPTEAERLQGLPDGYTNLGRGDAPRNKALGNSWAVPVVRWIGKRIAAHV